MIERVLRLKYESKLNYREIAQALDVSLGTVFNYLKAATAAGLQWPLPDGFDEAMLLRAVCATASAAEQTPEAQAFTTGCALELWEQPAHVSQQPAHALEPPAHTLEQPQLLSAPSTTAATAESGGADGATTLFAPIDFQSIHRELRHKGVTRQLLWEEYCRQCEGGALTPYRYTQFCVLYQRWSKTVSLSMRQRHRAGDKLFVDYCGPTIAIHSGAGQAQQAQVFVAVLGASNYTYAEATWTQKSQDWINSHVAAFNFFQGVPNLVVPDNLKSAVQRPCRYEPLVNASYQEMLAHYGTVALPARPYKPRDKAKVEVGVQVVERWILARLRHRRFFSLGEANGAISELLSALNSKTFKKLEGSRLSHFETIDRPALKPLPLIAYEYARWKKVRVHVDYHVEVDGHFYSVPHALVKRELQARITDRSVELLHGGKRVASHARSLLRGAQTTVTEHMPRAHQANLEWSPKRLLSWAQAIGPSTHFLVDHLLAVKPHPEQGYRSCIGLLSLARRYGQTRLEKACDKARAVNALSRASVESILKSGIDRVETGDAAGAQQTPLPLLEHENLRGAEYYR